MRLFVRGLLSKKNLKLNGRSLSIGLACPIWSLSQFILDQAIGEKTMPETLNELNSIEELNRVLKASTARLVLLFKHSLTCPISARAYREFQSYLEKAEPHVSYHLITVQTARAVSNEAAARLRVEHHSPQAILVRDGREVWNASHFEITAMKLDVVIKSHLS